MSSDPALIQLLGTVYELALALTSDPEPERNTRKFLRVLMSKLRCGYAGVWLRFGNGEAEGLRLLASIPRATGQSHLPPSHPLMAALHDPTFRLYQEPLPRDHPLVAPIRPMASNAVLAMDGAGLLVLGDVRPDGLDPRTLRAVAPLVWRLGVVVGAEVDRDRARAALEAERNRLATRVREQTRTVEETDARLQGLLEAATDPIAAVDAQHRLVMFNAAYAGWFEAFFGKRPDAGVCLPDLLQDHPDARARLVKHWTTALSGTPLTVTEPYLSADGATSWFECTYSPVRRTDGEAGATVVARDVTARVLLQQSLLESEAAMRRARRLADEANRAKSVFLANVSHEIRTPLNAVVGMTSLLAEGPLDGEQRDYVDTIRTSTSHLLAIVNDLLDLAKIEAGRMDLALRPFAILDCLESTVRLVASEAAHKDLEILYEVRPGTPAGVIGDEARIRQVLVNLVGNAVKFTPRGEVVLTACPGTSPTGEPALHLEVRDTGSGIPADEIGRLFEPFVQGEVIGRRMGGTGLGLAISKRLVHLMGGSIRVESRVGEGSTFIVELPAAPAVVEGTTPAGTDPTLSGRAALVVVSHPHLQQILTRQLESWGMRTATRPSDAGPVDVALIEDADALLAAHQAGIPLVVQLGAGPGGEVASARLPKPVLVSELYELLVTSIVGGPAPRPPRPARRLSDELPLRILVVEDNPVNQRVALLLLERLGYRAEAVADGTEALAALERRDYDLVLLDIEMPGLDGYQTSRAIRNRWPKRALSIMAMTAHAGAEYLQRAIAAGMDDYIDKPIDLASLEGAIRRVAVPA